jgi:ribosomal protein S18 acetylase RimI-like enzyme
MSADTPYLVQRDGFELSSDPARVDRALVHDFLSRRAYWSEGVPRDVVDRAIDHSLCFGVYRAADPRSQVAFARVVTDRATFAYLCDVFVLEDVRGQGVGKWMIERVLDHADLQGLRRFMLLTRDAHSLYQRHGFAALANPSRVLERVDPDIYTRPR